MSELECRLMLSQSWIRPVHSFTPLPDGGRPQSTLVADAEGNLYGTTGTSIAAINSGIGTVFEIARGTGAITTLARFDENYIDYPGTKLAVDSAGNIFGTTEFGGTYEHGSVFEIARGSGAITTVVSFNSTDGAAPLAGVVIDPQGNLFGTTSQGGLQNLGTVFEIANGTNAVTTLTNTTSGYDFESGLAMDPSGNLFGASSSGTYGSGVLFEVVHGSNTLTSLGSASGGTPTVDANDDLFGTYFGSTSAGSTDYGSVWEDGNGSNGFSLKFNKSNGANPNDNVAVDASGNVFGTTRFGGAHNLGTVFEVAHGSNAITTLASFNGPNGSQPYGGLHLDSNNNLIGTTFLGGATGMGVVFELPVGSNTISALAQFRMVEGSEPIGGVIRDASGILYGVTDLGGANNVGTIFAVDPSSGTTSTLASFPGPTAQGAPAPGLTIDTEGNLFGAIPKAGNGGDGTLFELAHGSNAITTIATFNWMNGSNPASGSQPNGGLAIDAAGNLFGTTRNGGSQNVGTVFEVRAGSSTISTLASFDVTDGSLPDAGVTLDANGNLYGTTTHGGANGDGTVFELARGSNTLVPVVNGTATVAGSPSGGVAIDGQGNLFGNSGAGLFELPAGSNTAITLTHPPGVIANRPVIDSAGDLFDTTWGGNADSYTVFEIPAGTSIYMMLGYLDTPVDGSNPSGIFLDPNGNLFGTAKSSGGTDNGTVFEIPAWAMVGQPLNSGFENPYLSSAPPNNYSTQPVGASWSFSGGAGMAGNGSLYTLANPDAPEGLQVGYLEGAGSSLSQTFYLDSGTFELTFDAAQRANAEAAQQDFEVLVDGTSVGQFTPSSTNYALESTAPFTVTAGRHTIEFLSIDSAGGDNTALIDDVEVEWAPASNLALMGAPVINGDNPNGLYNAPGQTTPGTQRSMVEDIVYTFNEPVTITDANQAFTLAVAGPAGGTLPTTLYAQAVASSNGTRWAVSLMGMPEGTIASIANGEYSITINPAYVFAAADGVTSMAPGTGRTDTFYRLYGDVFGTGNVNNADYNLFKKSINTYNPAFDDFGTGTTSSNADYNVFKKDLNISYFGDGFVTTI